MARLEPNGGLPSTGPPDRETLRVLERTSTADPLVASTVYHPDPYEPRALSVRLDDSQYPATIVRARIDVRWYVTGDFSFHYVESQGDGDNWECRWDRHPNPHDPRLHFHQPPDAEDIVDLSLPSLHPLEVSATVLGAVSERVESLWANEG